MKNAVILFLFAISLLSSCTEERLNIDTSVIDVHLNFKHYEQDLFTINRNNIEKAYIQGVAVDLNNHQKELFDKYKNR